MTERALFESGLVPLDKGAAAYVIIDVPKARPILEGISYIPMTDKNIKQMLDKTQSAAAGVFLPSSEETRRFQLVSWGTYPASGSSIAFGTNKDWKKQHSAFLNTVYWYSDKAQMSVAVGPSQVHVLAAMTKTPHDPIPVSEGIKIPDGLGEFGKGAVFSCWLSDPRSLFSQKLREAGIPLELPAEQFFVCLFPADEQASASQPASRPASASRPLYEALIKIGVQNANQVRAVSAIIPIIRTFIPPTVAPPTNANTAQNKIAILSYMLFTNPVVQDGNSLIIKTPPLSVNEIALLFSMFSL